MRAIGASNFGAARLAEALAASARLRVPRYESLQPLYNLYERAPYEAELEPLCRAEGIGVINFYALARGFLTGKYQPGITVDSPRAKGVEQYLGPRGDAVLTALAEVAAAHGVRQAAVALAWLLAKPGVVAPLASARTVDQLDDLLAVGDLELTADEVAALDAASA